MSQDNHPRRSEPKGNSVFPTFLWYLFLIVTFVSLIAVVFANLSVPEISAQHLRLLVENSYRDPDGTLAENMTGYVEVKIQTSTNGHEQVRYSNLRDVKLGTGIITGKVDVVQVAPKPKTPSPVTKEFYTTFPAADSIPAKLSIPCVRSRT